MHNFFWIINAKKGNFMHWLDKEIVVVEIYGRFFALNGWDG